MRKKVTIDKLKDFMRCLAAQATSSGTVYLVGGSTALLLGIREQTIDIDLKLDPEPGGVFEAIAKLKNELELNIEITSPDDFIPAPSNWRDRSIYIDTINAVKFYHYDLVTQALAKIERGYSRDLEDVKGLLNNGHITPDQIRETLCEIKDKLFRYPAVDAGRFERRVGEFLSSVEPS